MRGQEKIDGTGPCLCFDERCPLCNRQFYRDLDNPAADPFEVQKRQHELGITNQQIDAHKAERNARINF